MGVTVDSGISLVLESAGKSVSPSVPPFGSGVGVGVVF